MPVRVAEDGNSPGHQEGEKQDVWFGSPEHPPASRVIPVSPDGNTVLLNFTL